jgi:hypothetical protein
MAARVAARAAGTRAGSQSSARPGAARREGGSGDGPLGWLLGLPGWALRLAGVMVLVLLVAGGGYWFYRALDPLYPQEVWRYFRPAPALAEGSVLFRDMDGQLFLAPVAGPTEGRRLLDPEAAARGHEIVRDALALPSGPSGGQIAYFATERVPGQPDADRLKVISRDGAVLLNVPLDEPAGEPLRPALFLSTSGRYLGVTNRDRTRAYYFVLSASGPLTRGEIDAPPERMLWTRNGDLRTAHVPGQAAFAASPDGTQRALVRAGKRRAPECGEPRCEAGQELVVSSGTVAGSGQVAVLYGAFSSFSSEGWGFIPAQLAQRLYGRLIWSPDGRQLLFSTLDGADSNSYAISTDGRTQPRLVLESGEALDWLP